MTSDGRQLIVSHVLGRDGFANTKRVVVRRIEYSYGIVTGAGRVIVAWRMALADTGEKNG